MTRANESVVAMHKEVEDLCVERLQESFDQSTLMFDRQLRNKRWEETLGTEALTSSAICLIGMHRAAVDVKSLSVEPIGLIEALCAEVRRRRYPGAVGLVVWANAVWRATDYARLLELCGLGSARYADLVSRFTTMEAAWLVSGLIHESPRSNDSLANAHLLVVAGELMGRFDFRSSLFVHASARAPIVHRARMWVANFADQIYSVQALALVSLTRGDKAALQASNACARRLVQLQGSLGQWWWHYDPRDGAVAQGYPVYSVHQHAMAPMALMTLAAAGGTDHRGPVELSHNWIDANEAGQCMLDRVTGTIWRDIAPMEGRVKLATRLLRNAVGLGQRQTATDKHNLSVNYETRPYEWAWCLYAGAIAADTRCEGHPV